MINPPGEPTGTSREANWLRRFRAFAVSCRLLPGVGYKLRHSTSGTILEIEPARGGGGTTTSAQLYKITNVKREYLVCRTWDGTTDGTTDIYIAKPFKLRETLTGETIDNIAVAYSYSSSGFDTYLIRTARATISGQVTSEKQIVVPRYLVGDKIYAMPCSAAVITASDGLSIGTITLIDINVDGRAWARRYRQT